MLPFYILYHNIQYIILSRSLNWHGNALSQSKTMRLLYCWVYRGLFQFVHVHTCPTWTSPNYCGQSPTNTRKWCSKSPKRDIHHTFTIPSPGLPHGHHVMCSDWSHFSPSHLGQVRRNLIQRDFFAQHGYGSSSWGLPIDQQPKKTILSLYSYVIHIIYIIYIYIYICRFLSAILKT